MAGIEARVGRAFGSATDPLLVSVRSGAPISMPGMLDTILNLGLNDVTVAGLAEASGDADFAAACRERLSTMYRETVGADEVPDDPWQQLRAAIEAVFRSWDSDRAHSYRRKESIPADLGTAVVVQAMVFGNRNADSATGVLFTRNPATGENEPYGDILFNAQGEDVVAGTHATEPISVLDERMPEVARQLRSYADRLERHSVDICDIEFTIEDGRLWMLQNRVGKRTAQAACRAAVEMADVAEFPLSRVEAVERVRAILTQPPTVPARRSSTVEVVAAGLAASPGLASGAIATTPEAAVRMADQGIDVLLVRSETSPDDVHGMARSVGVLTSTGGLASHAAVVARGWDIPAVVGAAGVVVGEGAVAIGDRLYQEGDILSIDGSSGEVFGGAVASASTVVPEAETLLTWADELGIDIASSDEAARGGPVAMDGVDAEAGADELIRVLAIKGYVEPEMLAAALRVRADRASQLLADQVAQGNVKDAGGMFSLTDEGKSRGAALLVADQGTWGPGVAGTALDGFVALDARMKSIVTAWQMREVEGEQVLNDHADADYDAAVLADLAALAADASLWLGPCIDGLPRLSAYATRLDAAAAAAAQGDGRFIASPRVDSYHGIWFELHEDLIRLAGRTREEEVAAGRA
jgi:pyruvate,orthophosphate dikinase